MTFDNVVVVRVVLRPDQFTKVTQHAEAHGMTVPQFTRFSIFEKMRLDRSQGFKDYLHTFMNPWFFPYHPMKAK